MRHRGVSRRILTGAFALLVLWAPSAADAAFPGRNGRIAYEDQRFSPTQESQISSVLPNGSRPRTLLGFGDLRHTRGGSYAQPAYSPDGRRLAFSDSSFPQTLGSSLYLVRASGHGRLRQLTRWRNGKYDVTPGWAPDGRRLVYSRFRRHLCREQIRVYRAGGSRAILSPSHCGDGPGVPVWSVRGQIAFSWRDAIYTMRPDGSHRRRVVAGDGPDWSPHGHWIVFDRPGGGIAMIRPNGHGLRLLTKEEGPSGPVFSPDGRYIVYAFRPPSGGPAMVRPAQGSQEGLVVMRLRDRRKRTIVTTPPDHSLGSYDWQPLPRPRHR
jgi:Tol biopolymer transport system component